MGDRNEIPTASPCFQVVDVVQCRQKPEKQNGGCLTGNTYSSAYIQDRNELPTAIPCFLGSGTKQ